MHCGRPKKINLIHGCSQNSNVSLQIFCCLHQGMSKDNAGQWCSDLSSVFLSPPIHVRIHEQTFLLGYEGGQVKSKNHPWCSTMSCSALCNQLCRHKIKPPFVEHSKSQQTVGRINPWQQLWFFSILLVLFKGPKLVASIPHPTPWQDGKIVALTRPHMFVWLTSLIYMSSLLSPRSHYHSLHAPHGWGRHSGGPDCHHFSWQALLCWLFSLPEEPAGNRLLFDSGQKGCGFLSELLPKQQQHSFLSEKGTAGLFCSCLFFLHEIVGFLEAAAKIFHSRMSQRKKHYLFWGYCARPCLIKLLCGACSSVTVSFNGSSLELTREIENRWSTLL